MAESFTSVALWRENSTVISIANVDYGTLVCFTLRFLCGRRKGLCVRCLIVVMLVLMLFYIFVFHFLSRVYCINSV